MSTPVTASFSAEATSSTQWNVEGARVTSALNEPYLVRAELRSDSPTSEPLAMLGSTAELTMRHGERENAWSGIVSSVRELHHHGQEIRATLTLEPALSALRHGRDTRIFQDMGVDEILAAVLAEELAPYGRRAEASLQRAYPKREYTVQYQESHYDFVHRLMEEEGILYFFEQDGPVEKMILIDSPNAHRPLSSGHLLDYSGTSGDAGVQDREYVRSFEPASTVVGSEVATRHFDWTHPSALITGSGSGGGAPGEGPDGSSVGPGRESYQHDEQLTLHSYAGAYGAHDATDQARVLRETQLRDARRFQGTSTVVGLRTGGKFDLNQHPTVGLNAAYLVVAAEHVVGDAAKQASGGGERSLHYVNRFTSVPAAVAYRPRRSRPRPRIHGIQTAIVTGPPGEEIHCDEHGRVKVQFHWDRVGEGDDRTSCWIRCMQTSAGAGFGSWVLPRVGMEVVVSFIDGDPDRPLVTGTVFNGSNVNPYPMPAKKMVSLFKTNSYPGGGGFNELRFDDSKDNEEIWIHGEKDWNTLIQNDLHRDVLHDETQNVSNNRTRTVGVDETLSVGNDRKRSVAANETVTIGRNRTENIGLNETLTTAINRTRVVGATETVTVGAVQAISVGANRSVNVGGSSSSSVGGSASAAVGGDDAVAVGANQGTTIANDQNIQVGSNRDVTVGANAKESVGGSRSREVASMETVTIGVNQAITVGATRQVTVAGAYAVSVGAIMQITAGVAFQITCGESSLKMESGGKVTITGTEFEFVASGDVKIGGAMIHLN